MIKIDIDNGGRVKSYERDGRLILGTYKRIDGKIGNTHVCTPNFGNELSEYKMPFHGYARNEKWKILEERDNFIKIGYLMKNKDSYLTDLEIIQVFDTRKNFVHEVRVKNVGKLMAPVNIAIHYYFDMPYGWEDLRINDSMAIPDLIRADGEIGAQEVNKIDDGKRVIIMKTRNVKKLHLWSGGNEKFCCIEPVMGMRDLKKNEEVKMTIELGK